MAKIKVKKINRDDNGLIDGVDYIFNEDGMIDWRAMVRADHLVPNRDRTSETDVTSLKDNELIILLGGIKELAQIRGYTDLTYDVHSPSSDYVVATCSIKWIPNYETEGREVTFSAIGDASPNNTKSFAKYFLGPIAENRAFVRCVRNFLKINIVSQEELGNAKMSEPPTEAISSPQKILGEIMKDKGVSFEAVKKKLSKEDYENAEKISTIEDIPKAKIFELIERMKKI
ncbi:hypothetical protein CL634_07060 [bacterium]|nr:hypothetical protein [bacterium]|tara:strand:- start:2004 stop:2693 length:690 start_codon:yes stop_codon:yes gene_type:complete